MVLHTRPRQPTALSLTDDDPVLNPALSIKVQEFAVDLPPEGDILQAYFESGLDATLNLIRQKEVPGGWWFIDFQVLSMFTIQKEAMYRDWSRPAEWCGFSTPCGSVVLA